MSIHKPTKTIPFPDGAIAKGDKVIWITRKGDKKTGKLTKNGRVLVKSKTWQIRYRDENDTEIRESTKLTNEVAAKALLAEREKEIERIRIGVASRAETGIAKKRYEDIECQLGLFEKKQYASGSLSFPEATILVVNNTDMLRAALSSPDDR